MELYLLRHGTAEDATAKTPDEDRALTPDGREKLQAVLRRARGADVKPSVILSSPLLRARQTAEIAAEVLGFRGDIMISLAFQSEAPVQEAWDEIRLHKRETQVLVAGHNPQCSLLAGFLLNTPSLPVDFKKGALLRTDHSSFGQQPRGILRWFLTSKLA